MKARSGIIKYFLLVLFLTSSGVVANNQNDISKTTASEPGESSALLAILPLANYSGRAEADKVFSPLVNGGLSNLNFQIEDPVKIAAELRKFRIRSTATLGAEDAARLVQDLGIDYFLIGSIDIFLPTDIPEAALSLRLIDAKDMSILWANSVAASGREFEKMLGVGQIKSMDLLAEKLVEESFSKLDMEKINALKGDSKRQSAPLYTVVPFDNLSGNKYAGEIISAITLSDLSANNIHLLEPGVAIELFRQNGQYLRGELNLDLLSQLHDKYNVARVITGSIDIFESAPASVEGLTPEVEMGARFLDATTGKILAAGEVDRKGTDSETVFKLGITYSLGKVARSAAHAILEKLNAFKK